jgi:NAD(P)H-hydrate repair Nnr-like enzyme with NAD(P)H-hydrate dehydratase domain
MAVVSATPDVVLALGGGADAWCVGPGFDTSAPDEVRWALAQQVPVVIDAGALGSLTDRPVQAALRERAEAGQITVVTPHSGEFERMGGDTRQGRLAGTRGMARRLGAIVVLKGPGTVVASPSGEALVDSFAGPELAVAGTGDVLAGLIAGRLASAVRTGSQQGTLPVRDALLEVGRSVGLHGLAGRLASDSASHVTALEVLAELPGALRLAACAHGDPNGPVAAGWWS